MPTPPGPSLSRRAQLGRLLIGVSVVLVVSSVTWFSSGRTVVGVIQLVLGVVLAAAMVVYLRLQGRR